MDAKDRFILAAGTFNVRPGDLKGNSGKIESAINAAGESGARILFLPAGCICGLGCGSLTGNALLGRAIEKTEERLASYAAGKGVGLRFCRRVYPALAASYDGLKEAIETESRNGNATVICNPGWSESSGEYAYDGSVIICQGGKTLAGGPRFSDGDTLVTVSLPSGTPVSDFCGGISCKPERSARRRFPFIPEEEGRIAARCEEIFNIQSHALAARLRNIGCNHAVIGISGGLDSTLALLATATAFDILGLPRKNITAVTMPGFGTSGRTRGNAGTIMEALGTTSKCIGIGDAVQLHLKDIGHDPDNRNVTYENAQARERTQILMDLANDCNGMVIGTGDLSEAALGWCTFNGDHISMYNPNCGIPKTLMREMVMHIAKSRFENLADTLTDIVKTPVSPELLPGAQITEDLVGPYELHDYFIFHFIRLGQSPSEILGDACESFAGVYGKDVILKWLKIFTKRFISAQFKRNCCSDGPAAGFVSLSPKHGFSFASDVNPSFWLDDLCRE